LGALSTTTPGPVTLSSTFQCISIRARFTNDANANNTAAISYRKTGDSTWLSAYPPIVDRRAAVVILGTTNDNSSYQYEARGSIVGLSAATSYDVQVTWSDPDGIVGNAASTNTVSTLSYTPPSSGITRYVDASAGTEGTGTVGSPWKTITNAIVQASQGDTILVGPGRYASFTITSNGSPSSYYVLKTNGAGIASIQGGAVANSLTIAGNYWVIDGFNIEQSQHGGIHFNPGTHHVFVQNTLQTNAVSDTNELTDCAAVEVGYGGAMHDIYLLTNKWSTFNFTITNDNNGIVDLIDVGGGPVSGVVVADNILSGGWDAIGNRLNSGFNGNGENCDFCRNSFTNWMDDLIELDGLGPNVRFFSNLARRCTVGSGDYAGSLLSDCGTYIGPAYVFRNAIRGWYTNSTGANIGGGLGIKMGAHSSVGWSFYFHNTFVTSSPGGGHETVNEDGFGSSTANKTFRNNIFVAAGNIYYGGGTNNSHDYDLAYFPASSSYAASWNGYLNLLTLADIQLVGQETHGICVDPLLRADLTIPQNSPAVNAAVVLPNFNDPNSAWPPDGSAADIGAFEFRRPAPPVGLHQVF
jgi:hypothetical protein